jgi:demethylmenaquinone methyltransferase/2-methoxy-6-polyprenyl-1,4-benzoquinol methylase
MPTNEVDTSDPGVAQAAAGADLRGASRDHKRAYVQSIFSEIAPRYDLLNHLLSFNIDRLWRRAAIDELQWPRSPRGAYLDLCAGTLDAAVALARSDGFEGLVVAADFAEPMLRAGRRKAGLRGISPVAADALQLPVGDSCVAGAIVAFGLRNVVDLDAALGEVLRVLERGARFVILEFTTPRSRLVRLFYEFYLHRVLPAVGGWVSGHRTAYHWRLMTLGVVAVHCGTKGVR